ncbi:cadherin EGF LAG seven-pass G-type receptor 3-like [Uloborus diversus]|uniref:cadherin EGF LAG seven-pass G-type receptor 3-like n=1 Tax=Uloborus diversus TaxID=327109 RepID=UPI002409ED52|nr:cadherin EGF LAG seven-pass G-type receptor 3-like [Uloborus diversus]XP_054709711.1 cadherin EGF LAG seven-pass G-type receptor 3-like [Uloborus diversus]
MHKGCSRCGLKLCLSSLLSLFLLHALAAADDFSQDDRCYLSNGGSSESFTVREDLPVDSIIGTLPIPGDPSKDGDIELTLVSKNSPVRIQEDTKNLILKEPLDKEGISGLSSVLLDVACSKKETDDPSITIPVRVIVTDANDNAPVFVAAPYSVNISEVTVVGSTVIQGIKAVDKDQYGPFSTVEYHIEDGPYSHLLAFESRLEGHVILAAALDYETLPNFTVSIRAQDQGEPPRVSITTLTVWVQDADDQNPRFLSERYKAVLPEMPRPGTSLAISPAAIKAEDPDEGIQAPIQYTFNSDSAEYSFFELNRRTGQVTIRKAMPDDTRLPITLVIKATQMDNPDRYSLTTLTLESDNILPADLKFLQTEYVTTVLESAPVGQVVITVHNTKLNDKHVRLQLLENPSEEFAIQNTGEIIVAKPLDYERQMKYSFRVVASDGKTSDVARVNVTVMNVNDNDPTFAQPQYNFLVKHDDVRIGSLIGTIEVKDGDINDTIELNVKGPFARVFSISHKGELRVRSLEFLNASTCHVIVVATDNGVPPRQSSVPVTVQFPEDVAQSSVFKIKKNDSSLLLMIVFGVLLGTLIIVIITLTIYILKTKQYRDRLPNVVSSNGQPLVNKMATYMSGNTLPSNNNNKPQGGQAPNDRQTGVENPVFNMADNNYQGTIHRGQLPPSPSEVSAWQANGSLRDEHQMGTFTTRPGSGLSNGKVQNIYWPNGSIPRRVKKLSWEDEQPNRTELDPDVSVTPLGKTCNDTSKQPGLTVYF